MAGDRDAPLVASPTTIAFREVAPIAAEAVLLRAQIQQAKREAQLKRLGVKLVRLKPTPVRRLASPPPA